MGWLYMKSLKGHSGPRQYLDAQFTVERADTISKVLRSALVGMRVYYAAFEHVLSATGAREVWAAVCLVLGARDRVRLHPDQAVTLCRGTSALAATAIVIGL